MSLVFFQKSSIEIIFISFIVNGKDGANQLSSSAIILVQPTQIKFKTILFPLSCCSNRITFGRRIESIRPEIFLNYFICNRFQNSTFLPLLSPTVQLKQFWLTGQLSKRSVKMFKSNLTINLTQITTKCFDVLIFYKFHF